VRKGSNVSSPIAAAPAGRFEGRTEGSVDVWRGIPFAQPPVGRLRWRAPQPVGPLGDVEAFEFGPAAPQPLTKVIPLGDGVRLSEDCLNLNVWAPRGAATSNSQPKAVMVWLHGGAYVFGSTTQAMYDGTSLASNEDLVVVTIGYRLGALGFLDLSPLSTPAAQFDGNLALRDVLLALRWVQDNIAAFGGDPDRVTVIGESAGGGLVTTLLATPSAAGLFSRAIAHSSPVSSIYGQERAVEVDKQFLLRVGISSENIEDLYTIGVDRIVAAGMDLYNAVPLKEPGRLAFAPVIDGDLLPEAPITAIRAGRGLPVPLIIGTNRDEASLFARMSSPLMPIEAQTIGAMFADMHHQAPDIPLPPVDRVLGAYSRLPRKRKGLAIARDIGFRMPTLWYAEAHARVAPTWVFRFDQATPLLDITGIGASHATELPYLWGNFGEGRPIAFRLGGRTTAEQVSARMQARWGAFMRGEDPSPAGLVPWPAYTDDERSVLLIGHRDVAATDPDKPIREGWGDTVLAFP